MSSTTCLRARTSATISAPRSRLSTCKIVAFQPASRSREQQLKLNKLHHVKQQRDTTHPKPQGEEDYDDVPLKGGPIAFLSQASANLLNRFSDDLDQEEYADWTWFPADSGTFVHTSAALQYPVRDI